MNKIVYLIRHSGPFVKLDYEFKTFKEQNERMILSIEAEEKAKKIMERITGIKKVYSSNSARAIGTAKYLADINKQNVIIDDDLNEIILGINTVNDFPKNLYQMQFSDGDYKLEHGESVNEVLIRTNKVIEKILNDESDKISLVVHGIYAMCFLKQFCDVTYNDDKFVVIYKNRIIFDGVLNNPPEIFKFTFDEKELVSIENLRSSELSRKNTPLI